MICRICQNEIDTNLRQPDGSIVCPVCGASYRRKNQSIPQQPEVQPPIPQKRTPAEDNPTPAPIPTPIPQSAPVPLRWIPVDESSTTVPSPASHPMPVLQKWEPIDENPTSPPAPSLPDNEQPAVENWAPREKETTPRKQIPPVQTTTSKYQDWLPDEDEPAEPPKKDKRKEKREKASKAQEKSERRSSPKRDAESSQKRPHSKPKKKKKRIIVILIILFLIAVILGGVGFFYFTGKINLPFLNHGKAQIDPNIDVITVTPDQSLPQRVFADVAVVIADNVNIYTNPDPFSSIIATVNRGDRLPITDQADTAADGLLWYKIKINEAEGWLSSLYAVKYHDSVLPETNYSANANPSSTLFDLKFTEDSMHCLGVGINSHLCFTVNARPGQEGIYLVQKENSQTIGQMLDDGKGEDETAGDGIYTIGINICGSDYGMMTFFAQNADAASNELPVHFFQKATAENARYISNTFAGLRDVCLSFADAEGFVPAASRDQAIQTVASYVVNAYYDGDIAEYSIDDHGVCFREKRTGLLIMYDPKVQGELAAGGTDNIISGFPYATDKDGPLYPVPYTSMLQTICDRIELTSAQYLDSDASPEFFTKIKPEQIVIWFGHGGYHYLFHQYPFLVTGQYYSVPYLYEHADDFLYTRLCVSYDIINPRVCITPDYITKYCGDMKGAFIWLASCHSGQNSTLADSFLRKGASTVIGYSRSVYSSYDANMFYSVFSRMLKSLDGKSGSITIKEAIQNAQNDFGDNDVVFWDKTGLEPRPDDLNSKKPAQIVLFGDENYRLRGKLRPTPTPAPTDTPEPTATPTPAPTPTPYVKYDMFSLTGTWKSVGTYGFGQAQPGALVNFDGSYCNFYSPRDTYAVYIKDNKITLELSSFLFGENLTFEIQLIDYDHIKVIYSPNAITELTRVN